MLKKSEQLINKKEYKRGWTEADKCIKQESDKLSVLIKRAKSNVNLNNSFKLGWIDRCNKIFFHITDN